MAAPATAPQLGIRIQTPGIHHIALRSTDLARSRIFYIERLGFPALLEVPGMFIFRAGGTSIAICAPDANSPAADAFNPFRVGLDHIALGCADDAELQRVVDAVVRPGEIHLGVEHGGGQRGCELSHPGIAPPSTDRRGRGNRCAPRSPAGRGP